MGWGRSIRLFRAVREDGLRLRLDQDDVSEGLAVRGDRGEVGVQGGESLTAAGEVRTSGLQSALSH